MRWRGILPNQISPLNDLIILRILKSIFEELISVFVNDFVREAFRRQNAEIGDLVLIQCFGMQKGENFKRYNVEIEKTR
jgi:hypothetical protein